MEEYIKDLYRLFCGPNNREVKNYLYSKYVEKKTILPAIHVNLKGSYSEQIIRKDAIIKMIFGPYNIYDPIIPEKQTNIDFTNDEINSITERAK